jgi:hypothetical protein
MSATEASWPSQDVTTCGIDLAVPLFLVAWTV